MTETGKKLSKKSVVIASVIAVLVLIGGGIFGYTVYAQNVAVSDYNTAYAKLMKANDNANKTIEDVNVCQTYIGEDTSIASYAELDKTISEVKKANYPKTVKVDSFATSRKVQKQVDAMNTLSDKLDKSAKAYESEATKLCIEKATTSLDEQNKKLAENIKTTLDKANNAVKSANDTGYASTESGKKQVAELKKLIDAKPATDKLPKFKTIADVTAFADTLKAKETANADMNTKADKLANDANAHAQAKAQQAGTASGNSYNAGRAGGNTAGYSNGNSNRNYNYSNSGGNGSGYSSSGSTSYTYYGRTIYTGDAAYEAEQRRNAEYAWRMANDPAFAQAEKDRRAQIRACSGPDDTNCVRYY